MIAEEAAEAASYCATSRLTLSEQVAFLVVTGNGGIRAHTRVGVCLSSCIIVRGEVLVLPERRVSPVTCVASERRRRPAPLIRTRPSFRPDVQVVNSIDSETIALIATLKHPGKLILKPRTSQ